MKSSDLAMIASIFLLGLITYSYRYSFISARGKEIAKRIPQNLLRLLAPATFSAIIANSLLSGQNNPKELSQKLIVAGLSLAVAYLTKNIIATIIFGLILLHFLQAYLG
jgi:branched-subunit amino acid transport protein